jgi:hypothetical protein
MEDRYEFPEKALNVWLESHALLTDIVKRLNTPITFVQDTSNTTNSGYTGDK